MTDFNDDFNPGRGDLLYGKAATRVTYLDKWKSNWRNSGDFAIIDQLNSNIHLDNVNSYRDLSRLGALLSEKAQISTRQEVSQYHDALTKTRFTPTSVLDATAEKIKKGGEVAREWDEKKMTLVDRSDEDMRLHDTTRLAIRRACKFGIAYVATNEHLITANAKILYAIDDLILDEIINKSSIHRSRRGEKKAPKLGDASSFPVQNVVVKEFSGIPITTSEMRYIYRHWSRLKNVVKFYANFSRLELAPWEGVERQITDCNSRSIRIVPSDWKAYEEHLSQKPDRKTDLL